MYDSNPKNIFENLPSTIPVPQKISAFLGQRKYMEFLRKIDEWKRLIRDNYKEPWNHDGKSSALFLTYTLNLVTYYHNLAIAKFGEIVSSSPELLTKISATVQSIIMQEIKAGLSFKTVEYDPLSEKSTIDPLTIAQKMFNKEKHFEKFSNPNKSMIGHIYYHLIYWYYNLYNFAYTYYIKSLKYHIRMYQTDDEAYHSKLLLHLKIHASKQQQQDYRTTFGLVEDKVGFSNHPQLSITEEVK